MGEERLCFDSNLPQKVDWKTLQVFESLHQGSSSLEFPIDFPPVLDVGLVESFLETNFTKAIEGREITRVVLSREASCGHPIFPLISLIRNRPDLIQGLEIEELEVDGKNSEAKSASVFIHGQKFNLSRWPGDQTEFLVERGMAVLTILGFCFRRRDFCRHLGLEDPEEVGINVLSFDEFGTFSEPRCSGGRFLQTIINWDREVNDWQVLSRDFISTLGAAIHLPPSKKVVILDFTIVKG